MSFDWGLLSYNTEFMKVVKNEIFDNNSYLKFFDIKEGDIVLDIGASVGPFTWSIIKKKPSRVFCLEPHNSLFKTLVKNFEKNKEVTCLNCAIASEDGDLQINGMFNPESTAMWSDPKISKCIKFDSLIKNQNIDHIDFLKLDCEGGEYDIFLPSNNDLIFEKVHKVAGEFHLHNSFLKNRFKDFRDKFLTILPSSNYQLESMDGFDIKWWMWEDAFLDNYECIMVYIKVL